MKSFVALVMTLLFAAVAAAQEHTQRSNPPPPAAPEVSRYVSDEGRYSIVFPSQPKLSSQNISAPNGEPLVQRMAMAAGGDALFMVGYFDYPSGIVFNLDKARDGMLDSVKGTLLAQESISLGGAPGLQIKIEGRTDDGLVFVNRARFYDTKPRVFLLQCMVQKSQDSPTADEKCEQFFDSFRVRTTP